MTSQNVDNEGNDNSGMGLESTTDGGVNNLEDGTANTNPIPQKKRIQKIVTEWIIIFAVALIVAFLLRTFVISDYYIPSGSMIPTLQIGDKIIVDRLAYDFHSVHVGDIVVFHNPPADTGEPPGTDLVKRVIGLPNQTIWSSTNGTIYVNGKVLNEPWLTPAAKAVSFPRICSVPYNDILYSTKPYQGQGNCKPLHLGPNQYFMMGDNRGDSKDSRYFGPVSGSLIIGKVDLIWWRHGSFIFKWL